MLSLAGRMSLVALVIGTAVTASATERVTISLVLTGAIGWSFVPMLQLLTGLLLVRGATGDRLDLLDRYFAIGWPWLWWILAAQGGFAMIPAVRGFGFFVLLTAAVPILWTVRLLVRFCREELHLGRAQARRRTSAHQLATYVLVLAYVWFAVALWPRIVGVFG